MEAYRYKNRRDINTGLDPASNSDIDGGKFLIVCV